MTQSPVTPEDTLLWQRRIAAQANNRAWRLSELKSRSEAESQEMLHAAHASMHLWSMIGNENNKAHAIQLLAHVYALLGKAEQASSYHTVSSAYFLDAGRDAWEVACCHAVAANVAACARNDDAHRIHYDKAVELISALPDPEDREILQATLVVVPLPPSA
jgi:hypothetical protein